MRARSVTVLALVVVSVALLSGSVAAQDRAPADDALNATTQTADLSPDEHLQQQQQQGAVIGSPGISVHVPNPNVTPGQTNEVTVQISNDGELEQGSPEARQMVTTARSVTVEAEADGTPLSVESGEMAIGAVTENQPGQATIAVDVPENVDAGSYDLEVDVSYSYTRMRTRGGTTYDESETHSEDVSLEVDDTARFSIVNATTDATVGSSGTLEAVVENTGGETAHNASLALESSSAGLAFGQSAQDAAYVGELEPGETTTVAYDVTIAPDAQVRSYPLSGTVQFETPDGLQRAHEGMSFGVTPRGEQQFALEDVEAEFYVGEEGNLRGTVTNQGPVEARNVVVQYVEESPNLVPIERSVAVGNLDVDESASFRLPVEVSEEAEAIARTVDMAVQYRNAEFAQRSYADLEVTVDVAPQRDQFVVDVQNREVAAGEQMEVDVNVTNNMNQTVSNVEARLFADSPLGTSTDEAFAESIEPGETETMTFGLEADSSASTKTYPISFDFRYDDERGNSHLSDTTRVAIDVVESEGGLPWLVILAVLGFVGIAGVVYYQRR